ncbi:response regulator [candidate division FCPU426 bacterium]|nr:response regulator [candidate division FCPU426 bacterium]
MKKKTLALALLEDDADVAAAMRYIIEACFTRCDLRIYGNGAEFLSSLKRCVPDLLMTGIFMPGIDGYEVMMKLRKKKHSFPVVVVSASVNTPERMARAFALGAAEVILKPFEPRDLFIRLCRVLQQRKIRYTCDPVALRPETTVQFGFLFLLMQILLFPVVMAAMLFDAAKNRSGRNGEDKKK